MLVHPIPGARASHPRCCFSQPLLPFWLYCPPSEDYRPVGWCWMDDFRKTIRSENWGHCIHIYIHVITILRTYIYVFIVYIYIHTCIYIIIHTYTLKKPTRNQQMEVWKMFFLAPQGWFSTSILVFRRYRPCWNLPLCPDQGRKGTRSLEGIPQECPCWRFHFGCPAIVLRRGPTSFL